MIKKALREYLTLYSRPKTYLILVFVSLILLFYSVWQVKPVIVSPYDPLGLASHLPPCYWIGLALVLATSIFAFLDGKLRKDAIFITILIAVGLFLVGISVFVYESVREPTVYYPFSEVYNLLAARHIDIANPVHIGTYYSWPAYHFISASIVEITQAGFSFVRYAPLFFMLCLVLITYSVGKRLELTPNRCFLLSFLVLSSWVSGYAGAYNPRTLGMIFYLFVFMLILTSRRTVAMTVVAVLLFSALVLSHGFNSSVTLPALILLSIYIKEPRFVALFIVIFGAWTIYQVSGGVMEGAIEELTYPFQVTMELPQVAYPTASVVARTVLRYSMLSYLAVYVALVAASAILLLKRRIAGQRSKQVISLFCWSIGVALALALSYGAEGPYRIYILCLLPAACIIVLSFASRRVLTALMVALMCLFAALNLPANYSGDTHWGQVLTSELKGTEFLSVKIEPKPCWVPRSYCNGPGDQLIISKNTSQLLVSNMDDGLLPPGPGGGDATPLSGINYVAISKQGNDAQLYKWRNAPCAAWPQTEDGQRANLLYNNGYFQIYENPQWESWLKSNPQWESWLRFKHF